VAKKRVFVILIAMVFASLCVGQLSKVQIDGTLMPPKTIAITYDDAPYEKWQSASGEPASWTLAIMQYLASVERIEGHERNFRKGVPALVLFVSCHFHDEPPPTMPAPWSVMCMGARDQDEVLLNQIASLGFPEGNHSQSHIPAGLIGKAVSLVYDPQSNVERDALFGEEMCRPQMLLNKYQSDGWHFFRAVGLDWPDWAADVANANPCINFLQGPLGVDVGGSFVLDDGSVIGGDWDCPNQGLSAQECGNLYLRDIRTVTQRHGAILLLHHYVIPGAYALQLIKTIIEGLDSDIRIVDIREHPAFSRFSYIQPRPLFPHHD
jgi:hypothetical protein